MTALEVVRYCAGCPEFVEQWARLRGVNLPRTPLDGMIDEATGHDSEIARLFIADCFDLVVSRLPVEEM